MDIKELKRQLFLNDLLHEKAYFCHVDFRDMIITFELRLNDNLFHEIQIIAEHYFYKYMRVVNLIDIKDLHYFQYRCRDSYYDDINECLQPSKLLREYEYSRFKELRNSFDLDLDS